MKARWNAVNARARGLGTHLLTGSGLQVLARTPDLPALGAQLTRFGLLRPEDGTNPAAVDLAVRRHAANQLRTLARWCADRPEIAAVVFEDEDRRSLRALLRGAAQGAGSEARLSGLIPTPALPERALHELARQPTPLRIVTLLVAWRHPYGSPLLEEASGTHPDLFRIEVRVSRTFARRALRAARRGGARVRTYVRDVIDLENALAALVLAETEDDTTPKDVFIDGGERLTISVFEAAIATKSPLLAAPLLGQALPAPVGTALARAAVDPGRLERAVLRARIALLRGAARTDPLGPEPVLLYALRLRAEQLDLRRIIWGVALGAPPAELLDGLVSR